MESHQRSDSKISFNAPLCGHFEMNFFDWNYVKKIKNNVIKLKNNLKHIIKKLKKLILRLILKY